MTTSSTPSRNSRKATPAKRLFKLLLFLFLLHTLVTLAADAGGPIGGVRDLLVRIFWPPPDWVGEPLPVQQQIVYTLLSTLWALPFWEPLWALFGVPMLPLMAAVLCYSKFTDTLRKRYGSVLPSQRRYRNAKGFLRLPTPSLLQRLRMSRRLRRLKNQSCAQAEALCRRLREDCLAEVSVLNNPLHLYQNLSACPHWAFGRQLGGGADPLLRGLSLSRDRNGSIGLYNKQDDFLHVLEPNTCLWFLVQDGVLTFLTHPPYPHFQESIQIRITQER